MGIVVLYDIGKGVAAFAVPHELGLNDTGRDQPVVVLQLLVDLEKAGIDLFNVIVHGLGPATETFEPALSGIPVRNGHFPFQGEFGPFSIYG